MELTIVIFTVFANLILGFIAYIKNPKSASNVLLACITLILALWTVANYFSLNSSTEVQTLFWIRIVMLITSPLGPVIYLFLYSFPKNELRLSQLKSFLLIITTGSVIALSFTPLMFSGVSLKNGIHPYSGPGLVLYGLLMVISIGAGFIELLKKYRKAFGITKLQLKYLILGAILTFTLQVLTNYVLVAFNISSLVILGPSLSLVLVGCITYAIVRHRLLEIRFVIARSVAYILLVGIFASFYASAVFFVSQVIFHGAVGSAQLLVYVILALFVAFTFQPLKEGLEEFTDSIFFKGKYNSNQLLSSLTKIMATTLSLDSLMKDTLHILIQTLRVSRGAFIVSTELGYYPPVIDGYTTLPAFDLENIKLLSVFKRVMIFEEEENENIKDAMRKLDVTIVVPLVVGEKTHGLLLLGEKKSGEVYSAQDLEVLKIFGPEMSVAVQNAKSYEEIKHFNITLKEEINKATSDLQSANSRLQELDKLKDEFLSIASHELRTPMTAVKSYLWMALDGKTGELNEKQKLYLDRAYKSTNHLISLVNDLLNISRIESGRLTLDLQSVKLDIIAQEVIDEVSPRAKELGVNLILQNPSELPDVLADPEKIKEVIFNLIGNSLKFTPEHGTITLTLERKEGFVAFSIHDTGTGILPEDMPKLFQKFGYIQSNYLPDRPAQGTGLGLYICKKIVELHKGNIAVQSEGRGKGTTFTFTLKILDTDDLEMLSHKPNIEQKPSVGLEHQSIN